MLLISHGPKLSLELSQDVLWALNSALIFPIQLPEGSAFLLDLPNLDQLDLLSLFANLLFSFPLFLIFGVFERSLSHDSVLLDLLFAVVIGAIIVGIRFG